EAGELTCGGPVHVELHLVRARLESGPHPVDGVLQELVRGGIDALGGAGVGVDAVEGEGLCQASVREHLRPVTGLGRGRTGADRPREPANRATAMAACQRVPRPCGRLRVNMLSETNMPAILTCHGSPRSADLDLGTTNRATAQYFSDTRPNHAPRS